MPKLTKKRLLEIAKKYNYVMNNVINLKEFYDEKYNYVYNSYLSDEEKSKSEEMYNEALGLAIRGYKTGKLNEFEIDNLIDVANISKQQFFSIEKNIETMDYVKNIDENGKVENDLEYLDAQIGKHKKLNDEEERRHQEYEEKLFNSNYSGKTYNYEDVLIQAQEEHDQMLKTKVDDFNNDFKKDYKNKVLFDKDFFLDFCSSLGEVENTPNNQNKQDPLYKTARENMDYINTLDKKSIEGQRQIAMDRLNCYASLKNSFDSKSIGDFFKHPIDFIKEWWTLKGVKNEVKQAYNLTDKALDVVDNLYYKNSSDSNKILDDFAMLTPNGDVISTKPSQQNYIDMNRKLNKDSNTTIAKQNLAKIQEEFNKENLYGGPNKSQGHRSKEINAPTNDKIRFE